MEGFRIIKMNTYSVLLTDTFGDEPNYSWVRETRVKAKSFRGAIIKAKRELGVNLKHRKEENRDSIQLWFTNNNMVMFIEIDTWASIGIE